MARFFLNTGKTRAGLQAKGSVPAQREKWIMGQERGFAIESFLRDKREETHILHFPTH